MSNVQGGSAYPVQIVGSDVALSASLSGSETLHTTAVISDRDAAGRYSVANPAIVIDSTCYYDLDARVWQTLKSGAGNDATHLTNEHGVTLSLGGTNAGYVVRQMYQHATYQPGRGQEILMTGVMGAATANVTRRIGVFDSHDGLFFEMSATGLSVVRRSSTSGSIVDTTYPQASWNQDTMSTLDMTKDQVFVIRFLHLGTAASWWGFYRNGAFVPCHIESHDNVRNVPYMRTGTLPLRYEISSTAPATASLRQFCVAVNSSGGEREKPGRPYFARRDTPIDVSTEQVLVAIRPATSVNGFPNRMDIQLATMSIYATATATWTLYYYPAGSANPITDGNWVANSGSSVEYNINSTAWTKGSPYAIVGDFVVAAGVGGSTRGNSTLRIDTSYPLTLDACGANSPLVSNVGANPGYFVLAAKTLSGSGTAAGKISWAETP